MDPLTLLVVSPALVYSLVLGAPHLVAVALVLAAVAAQRAALDALMGGSDALLAALLAAELLAVAALDAATHPEPSPVQ